MIAEAKSLFTFDGLQAQAQISQSCDIQSYYSFASPFGSFSRHSQKQITLNFQVVIHEPILVDNLLCKLDGTRNLVNLGPGHVCQRCGEYVTAGRLKCHRCGGPLQLDGFASVSSFPFILVQYDIQQSFYDEPVVMNLELTSIDRVDSFTMGQLMSGVNLETLPHTLTLDTSKYLCERCGRVVEDGKLCPGCQGPRFPLSEVVKLERECLYCGSHVSDGVVCVSCGARLSGLSYRMVKERS